MQKDKKAVIIFYAFTMVISFAVMAVSVAINSTDLIGLAMWVPGVTGIVCAKIFYPKQQALGIKVKLKLKYVILGIIIPVIYLVPSYIIAWAILGDKTAGLGAAVQVAFSTDKDPTSILIPLLISMPAVFVGSLLTAAGEEIGWRGFAYPVLERLYGPVKATAINCVIWALWHFPIIIGGIYQAQVNKIYGLISFLVLIGIIGTIFCFTRSVSGSVVPAILLHTVHNAVDQVYLQPLSTNEKVPYLAGEQGIITIIIGAIVMAIVIISWRKSFKNKGAV